MEPGPLRATMSQPPKLQILREALSCAHCVYLVICMYNTITTNLVPQLCRDSLLSAVEGGSVLGKRSGSSQAEEAYPKGDLEV